MAVSSYQSIFDYIRSRVPGVEVNSNGTLRIRGGNGVVLITTKMAYEEQQQRKAAEKAEREARKAEKKAKKAANKNK